MSFVVTQPESLTAAPGEVPGVSGALAAPDAVSALAATQFVAATLVANAAVAG
jgi:hypothetical protein